MLQAHFGRDQRSNMSGSISLHDLTIICKLLRRTATIKVNIKFITLILENKNESKI